MGEFGKIVDQEGLGKESTMFTVDTGIDLFDFRNGKVEGDDVLTGLNVGTVTTFVGNPGSGKTSLAVQAGWSAVKDVPNGIMYIYDFENASSYSRLQAITGASMDEIQKKVQIFSSDISVEKLYKLIRGLAKVKVKNRSQLEIDSGRKDANGDPIMMLPPTIIVIDSWSTMYSDSIADISNEEFQNGNMSGAQDAKLNKMFLKGSIAAMQKSNISLYIVAQFSTKVETGPIKKAATLNYLGQDENISGGKYCIYIADTLVKLTASSKLEPDKDFGIKGFFSRCKFIKSRSNEAGSEITLVFEQKTGFNNILTNFNFCKDMKLLKGSPRAYYFEGAEDYKFTQKTFVDVYNKNPEFAEWFDNMCKDMYMSFIYDPTGYDNLEVTDDNEEEIDE